MEMSRSLLSGLLVALMTASAAGPVVAQAASPAPSPGPSAWPSGNQLRRSLQEIGFAFRVARDSGEWLGWAPRATVVESPALSLGGNGGAAATASFTFSLLETDLLGTDVDGTLTALLEVAARLPLDAADVERTRRFLVDDLLTEPPEVLDSCYARIDESGAILVLIETTTGLATLRLGPNARALELDEDLETSDCAPIVPSVDGPPPGTPTSERLTIGTSSSGATAFEPAEPELEGDLVTVVLTFRNDSEAVQSLTFEAPLEADTGPVEPGELKLIVVRQLEPGDHAFYSVGDPEGMRGVLHVSAPADE